MSLDKLYLGSYKVKEVGAPDNYVNTGEEKIVTLAYGGQEVEIVFSETTFKNNRQKAEVNVLKQDNLTKKPLDGGQYSLYAGTDIYNCTGKAIVTKGTLIETVTTNEEGKAKFKADLPIDASYYVTETKAPAMYRRNSEDRFGFDFKFTNDKEAVQTFTHTFENERVDAKIDLIKKDKETGIAQGDATLEGAVYGLYAREDIVHPDRSTGVIYKKDTKIAELTTDKNGKAGIKDLYLGKYYIKEIKAPVGYVLDENDYDLDIADEGDLTATVEKQVVSLETVKKQPFQIIKAAENGKTDADLLKGVGFTAYLESTLKVNKDGSYDSKSAKPVVIGENGATEIFTDENGHAVSIPLPYGTYIVRETTTPHNYKPVEDFVVNITENSPNKPQVWRVLLDKEFEAKLKITKKDDETNKSVLLKDTAFKIFNMDTKKYVEQVTTYPTVVKHKVFYTNEEGYLDGKEHHELSPEAILCLTNADKMQGATYILHDDIMAKIAEVFGGDYFVLPSSVHECLMVPDNGMHEIDALSGMVKDVNDTIVDPEEILSYKVQHYDSKAHVLENAKKFEQRRNHEKEHSKGIKGKLAEAKKEVTNKVTKNKHKEAQMEM